MAYGVVVAGSLPCWGRQRAVPAMRSTRRTTAAAATGGASKLALMPDEAATLSGQPSPATKATILAVYPSKACSPYDYPRGLSRPPPLWGDVLQHLAKRIAWIEPGIILESCPADDLEDPSPSGSDGPPSPDVVSRRAAFFRSAAAADIVLFLDLPDAAPAVPWLRRHASAVPTVLSLGCGPLLRAESRLSYQPSVPLLAQAAQLMPWSRAARDAQLLTNVETLFARRTPSDLCFALLCTVDAAVAPLTQLSVNKKTTPGNILCMVRHCAPQIVACVNDPQCGAALKCLEECGLNDQVCSYRCIVSYESPLFEEFTLCNLLKHNCLNNHAQPPTLPSIAPLATWGGAPMTHELAEQLFIGWLGVDQRLPGLPGDALPWSWKVVCGQNPAYDFFGCQHQIFYYAKNGKTMWYDPVFRVEKLDGTPIWRRRHYRVRRAQRPGTFTFSVLDNGVTSLEFWRIVDVAEDLSWALFYYSGAAEAAGQSYSGAVFVTPDGNWPAAEQLPAVEAAHAACGIAMWELSEVDNSCCDGAPLELMT